MFKSVVKLLFQRYEKIIDVIGKMLNFVKIKNYKL